jgi:hypothetical protein
MKKHVMSEDCHDCGGKHVEMEEQAKYSDLLVTTGRFNDWAATTLARTFSQERQKAQKENSEWFDHQEADAAKITLAMRECNDDFSRVMHAAVTVALRGNVAGIAELLSQAYHWGHEDALKGHKLTNAEPKLPSQAVN